MSEELKFYTKEQLEYLLEQEKIRVKQMEL